MALSYHITSINYYKTLDEKHAVSRIITDVRRETELAAYVDVMARLHRLR